MTYSVMTSSWDNVSAEVCRVSLVASSMGFVRVVVDETSSKVIKIQLSVAPISTICMACFVGIVVYP